MLSLNELGAKLDLCIDDSEDFGIVGLNTLKDSTHSEISFLENKRYLADLANTNAGAVFISEEFKHLVPKTTIALVTPEPYVMLAKASKLFAPPLLEVDGNEAIIGQNTTIMENVHLGKNTIIGNNVTIMSGSFIGDNVLVGNDVIIYPNVTIYRDCVLGHSCTIHAGTVIGSDGFGFATTKDGQHIKIYQNGNVTIGSDVEIGANCTIDRGAFASTVIDDMVRIDNLVHIGHNCKIAKGCIFAGQAGLSGSTILNEYVVMAGQSATTGHLEIAPFTTISGRGVVSKSIKEPKKQWAGFPLMEHRAWLKLQGKLAKLLKG